jgi:hypothetical protein
LYSALFDSLVSKAYIIEVYQSTVIGIGINVNKLALPHQDYRPFLAWYYGKEVL